MLPKASRRKNEERPKGATVLRPRPRGRPPRHVVPRGSARAPALAWGRLGRALDEITSKLGRDAVGVGLGGLKTPPGWEMKRATTHWDELPVAVS